MKRHFVLAAALAAASLSTQAFAAEGSAGFVRAEVGKTRADFDFATIKDTAYSLRGGYFFNSNVGIEGFYTSHGRDKFDGVTYESFGMGVGVVGKKNFGGDHQGFYLGGRAGLALTDIAEVDGNSVEFGDDTRDTNLYVGVGLGYDFTEKFGMGLNYDYQKADYGDFDASLKTWTVSGEFRF